MTYFDLLSIIFVVFVLIAILEVFVIISLIQETKDYKEKYYKLNDGYYRHLERHGLSLEAVDWLRINDEVEKQHQRRKER